VVFLYPKTGKQEESIVKMELPQTLEVKGIRVLTTQQLAEAYNFY
jgi:hypothetical protein